MKVFYGVVTLILSLIALTCALNDNWIAGWIFFALAMIVVQGCRPTWHYDGPIHRLSKR